MYEVPVIAWLVAGPLGVLVLALCAYEVLCKAGRLRRDLDRLQALAERAGRLQRDVGVLQAQVRRVAGATSPGAD